jgi:calcineurin-like phosphoesterase
MENYSIKVIDMMGRVISNETVNNTTGSFSQALNINKLTAGIYMISVESNGNREVTKLIKK